VESEEVNQNTGKSKKQNSIEIQNDKKDVDRITGFTG
jgi:hypothetical protein